MEEATRFYAEFFKKQGIEKGMRVATFVRPGLSFVPVIFALFRVGAVPVFIDPGMTPANMLACVEESECKALVGVPLAHLLKRFKQRFFKSVKISVCLTQWKWLGKVLGAVVLPPVLPDFEVKESFEAHVAEVDRDELAAILFTSGSTGVPKGVEVTFGILWGQQKILREHFQITEDEIDMVPFPLFALFSAAWGITSVIPDMNPAKPAKCSGEKLAEMMLEYNVTHTAGSPAIWKNVLDYAKEEDVQFPALKRVLMAGAPVSESLVKGWQQLLSEDGHVFTPYGATEALPVSVISDQELMDHCYQYTGQGSGTCIGREMGDVKVKVIPLSDGPIDHINRVEELPPMQVGELVVQGPLVTRRYFNRPESTHMSKINDWDKSGYGFWHRMGDVGYRDHQGRLWFCGRKDHRVTLENRELFPVQIEPLFNQVPGVYRTAVVGVPVRKKSGESKPQRPVLMVELEKGRRIKASMELENELLSKAQQLKQTQEILDVLFVKDFPTDVRHNIKINRPQLAEQATEELQL